MIDISHELIITPYFGGIKLCRPTKNRELQKNLSVSEALKLPCNVYFLNTESEILNINEFSAATTGYQSINEAIGSSVFDVLTSDNAKQITQIDKNVVQTKMTIMNDDVMIRRDDTAMNFITVKAPIFNGSDNKVIGLLGCSVMLQQQPMAESLQLMAQLGLLNSFYQKTNSATNNIESNIESLGLSYRQSQIAHYIIRGFSAKKISECLALSNRTVEHYIELIKNKLSVHSKAELIDKIIQLTS